MNENAKKWLIALRSGKYNQGTGCLCFLDKYCCLGVACEIASFIEENADELFEN